MSSSCIAQAPDEDLVLSLRSSAVLVARSQAWQLACVAELVRRERADQARRGDGGVGFEQIVSLVTAQVSSALGISRGRAEGMVVLAEHLGRVLPETLAAVDAGRLDVGRARVLSEATCGLDDAAARRVQSRVLTGIGVDPADPLGPDPDDAHDPQAGEGPRPWASVTPRTWRERVARAVVTADPEEARRRREEAVKDRCLRIGPDADGMGTIWGRLPAEDTVTVEDGVAALADAWPRTRRRRSAVGGGSAAGGRVRGPVPPRPDRRHPAHGVGGCPAVGGPGGGERPARRHLLRRRTSAARAG